MYALRQSSTKAFSLAGNINEHCLEIDNIIMLYMAIGVTSEEEIYSLLQGDSSFSYYGLSQDVFNEASTIAKGLARTMGWFEEEMHLRGVPGGNRLYRLITMNFWFEYARMIRSFGTNISDLKRIIHPPFRRAISADANPLRLVGIGFRCAGLCLTEEVLVNCFEPIEEQLLNFAEHHIFSYVTFCILASLEDSNLDYRALKLQLPKKVAQCTEGEVIDWVFVSSIATAWIGTVNDIIQKVGSWREEIDCLRNFNESDLITVRSGLKNGESRIIFDQTMPNSLFSAEGIRSLVDNPEQIFRCVIIDNYLVPVKFVTRGGKREVSFLPNLFGEGLVMHPGNGILGWNSTTKARYRAFAQNLGHPGICYREHFGLECRGCENLTHFLPQSDLKKLAWVTVNKETLSKIHCFDIFKSKGMGSLDVLEGQFVARIQKALVDEAPATSQSAVIQAAPRNIYPPNQAAPRSFRDVSTFNPFRPPPLPSTLPNSTSGVGGLAASSSGPNAIGDTGFGGPVGAIPYDPNFDVASTFSGLPTGGLDISSILPLPAGAIRTDGTIPGTGANATPLGGNTNLDASLNNSSFQSLNDSVATPGNQRKYEDLTLEEKKARKWEYFPREFRKHAANHPSMCLLTNNASDNDIAQFCWDNMDINAPTWILPCNRDDTTLTSNRRRRRLKQLIMEEEDDEKVERSLFYGYLPSQYRTAQTRKLLCKTISQETGLNGVRQFKRKIWEVPILNEIWANLNITPKAPPVKQPDSKKSKKEKKKNKGAGKRPSTIEDEDKKKRKGNPVVEQSRGSGDPPPPPPPPSSGGGASSSGAVGQSVDNNRGFNRP